MNKRIDASPTKSFFVKTITKDINLMDAILDLVDNSIDSYIKNKFTTFKEIEIIFNDSEFSITDNCGGIPKEKVYDRIFRFGNNSKDEEMTIGVFGVGLKRSIFKLGKDITIESDDGDNYYSVKIDEKWLEDENDWKLDFFEEKESTGNQMTKITVKELFDENSREFQNKFFENSLLDRMKNVYSFFIENRVNIKINGRPVDHFEFQFINQDNIFKPYYKKGLVDGVQYEILAGFQNNKVDKSQERKFGWFVFCNDRLVLKNDVSLKTGWGFGDRKYHYPEDDRFLGLLFMRSKDPLKLPWNTTKEDIQTENIIYKSIKIELESITNKFIDFIRSSGRLKDPETNETVGKNIFLDRDIISFKEIKDESEGSMPDLSNMKPDKIKIILPSTTIISYSKKKEIVKSLKEALGDPYMSNKTLGEKTFDFVAEVKEVKK